MATDPAPFLSTIILASAGLVAIVGGLLVARFVTLDSDQRGSRKVLADATARLKSAQQRAEEARGNLLDWHARHFLRGPVLNAISVGTPDPVALMQLGDWPFSAADLQPFVTKAAEEFALARTELRSRGSATDRFTGSDAWDQFRRCTPGLPEIRWDRVWARAFSEIAADRADEREAVARQRPQPTGLAALAAAATSATAIGKLDSTDYGAIKARRDDELYAAAERAQQRVEDYEGELERVQSACSEIVRPDAWLWWGVGVLTVFAITGVGIPMWVMSLGPSDLAGVRWLIYPFAASLLMLIAYIVLYLMHLTRAGNRTEPGATTT